MTETTAPAGAVDVAGLEALMEKATQGPYAITYHTSNGGTGKGDWSIHGANGDALAFEGRSPREIEDGAYIVAALNALPSLLSALKAAGEETAERQRLVDTLTGQLSGFTERATAAESRATALAHEVERMREALGKYNDRLRSAAQIAGRDGADTNWKAFRGQVHYTLAEYHELVNAARAALSPQLEEGK